MFCFETCGVPLSHHQATEDTVSCCKFEQKFEKKKLTISVYGIAEKLSRKFLVTQALDLSKEIDNDIDDDETVNW